MHRRVIHLRLFLSKNFSLLYSQQGCAVVHLCNKIRFIILKTNQEKWKTQINWQIYKKKCEKMKIENSRKRKTLLRQIVYRVANNYQILCC